MAFSKGTPGTQMPMQHWQDIRDRMQSQHPHQWPTGDAQWPHPWQNWQGQPPTGGPMPPPPDQVNPLPPPMPQTPPVPQAPNVDQGSTILTGTSTTSPAPSPQSPDVDRGSALVQALLSREVPQRGTLQSVPPPGGYSR